MSCVIEFKALLLAAKAGDEKSVEELIALYHPMLVHHSIVKGKFDEDLYQELVVVLLNCVRAFKI